MKLLNGQMCLSYWIGFTVGWVGNAERVHPAHYLLLLCATGLCLLRNSMWHLTHVGRRKARLWLGCVFFIVVVAEVPGAARFSKPVARGDIVIAVLWRL